MITTQNLDLLVEKYQTIEFIKDDPIQFPHRFKMPKDIELTGFLASCFAFGNRKIFIKKLNELFDLMQNEPLNFIENFEPEILNGFNYRFAKDFDVVELCKVLHKLYKEGNSLEELFKYGYQQDILPMLQSVCDYFYANSKQSAGFCFLVPNPKNGGAMKRMNMYLRWMIRKPPVDLGIWNFIPESKLLIPLDVHVARISRKIGLLKRSSNDFKAVLELTENLKKLDTSDPTKYDFAMFGYGINDDI